MLLLPLRMQSRQSWWCNLLRLFPNQMRYHFHCNVHLLPRNHPYDCYLLWIVERISPMVVHFRCSPPPDSVSYRRLYCSLLLRSWQEINQRQVERCCYHGSHLNFPLGYLVIGLLPCYLQERHSLHWSWSCKRWPKLHQIRKEAIPFHCACWSLHPPRIPCLLHLSHSTIRLIDERTTWGERKTRGSR